MLDLPFPKLPRKNKSSCTDSPQPRSSFTSPLLEQYERVAAHYKRYINELAPKIEVVYKMQDYRNYLKEQKLNTIKSQLINKKHILEKQLEDKMDPTKSPNGKLHSEILSLTQLETNYSCILSDIQKGILEKQEEIRRVQKTVMEQKEAIKGLLKYDFKHMPQQSAQRLPKIYRNSSESCFWSRESAKGTIKHSRETIINKAVGRITQRINSEEEKVIMLRLFMLYHAQPDTQQNSACLIESIQKQLALRQELIKQIKKEVGQIEGRTSFVKD